MAVPKIYPPNRLDDEGVTETAFDLWKDKLEIYLESNSVYDKFMHDGDYNKWKPYEEENLRITDKVKDTDDLKQIRKE